MRAFSLIVILLVCLPVSAQKKKKANLKLTNAVVIGQVDTPEDRYSLEINLVELLGSYGVKSTPSLNVLKLGSDARLLAQDSVLQALSAQGYNTFLLFTVKGYDRRFKPSNLSDDFERALNQGSFYDLYREGIVSVSFEVKFFREGACVHAEVIKCGSVSDRESIMKRLRKKVGKRLKKAWKK